MSHPLDQLGYVGQLCQSSHFQVLPQLHVAQPQMEPNILNTPSPKQCHHCGEIGHSSKKCPQKIAQKQQANNSDSKQNQQHQVHKVNKVKPSYVYAKMNNATIEVARSAQNVVLGTCEVNSTSATVLFDSKASHSFIRAEYANEHNLPMQRMKKPMHVSCPRGEVKTNHICSRVCLKISGVDFPADLVVLESEGIDVILGLNWLAARKAIVHDMEMSVFLTVESGEMIEYVAPSPSDMPLESDVELSIELLPVTSPKCTHGVC